MITISPVTANTQATASQLLRKANLPFEDINNAVSLYALTESDDVIGTIGLEHDHTTGLLRSLSVDENKRGKGYGDTLVHFIEDEAKQKGIQILFLLTTTASGFFAKKGYSVVSRTEVPAFIQQTSEFTSVCPASATIMKKILA